jgi:hypothetical protein
MRDVTEILSAIEAGDPHAAEQLLPLVYDELGKLAAQRLNPVPFGNRSHGAAFPDTFFHLDSWFQTDQGLAKEKPGQTLQATALVHEAYLRLVDVDKAQAGNSRGHFFAAAPPHGRGPAWRLRADGTVMHNKPTRERGPSFAAASSCPASHWRPGARPYLASVARGIRRKLLATAAKSGISGEKSPRDVLHAVSFAGPCGQ